MRKRMYYHTIIMNKNPELILNPVYNTYDRENEQQTYILLLTHYSNINNITTQQNNDENMYDVAEDNIYTNSDAIEPHLLNSDSSESSFRFDNYSNTSGYIDVVNSEESEL